MSRLVDPGSTPNSTHLLPEIWEAIFDYVPSSQLLTLRLVCRHWRAIVTNCPTLMEKLTFTIYSPAIAYRHFDIEHCPAIAKNLRFISVRFVEVPSRWPSIAENWTHLDIGNLDVSLSTLLEMLRYAVNLRKLIIYKVDVKDIVKQEVNFKLEKLESLHLNSVTDANFLFAFEQLCPNLKHFHIGLHHGNHYYDEECIIKFVKSVESTLKNLWLSTSSNFLAELASFEKLKLNRFVYGRKDEPEQKLVRFCQTQPSLEYLRTAEVIPLDGCRALTNLALCEIGRNLPNLKHLFTAIEPDSSRHVSFLGAMLNLKCLSLISHHKEIDFNCYRNPNLTELYLGYIRPTQNSLSKLLSGYPNLKSLSLRSISFISWTEVFTAIKPLKLLQSLELWDPRLESQTLPDCPIDASMENLHSLTLIEFKMAEPVMAELFRALLHGHGSQLRFLQVYRFTHISEKKALRIARTEPDRTWQRLTLTRDEVVMEPGMVYAC